MDINELESFELADAVKFHDKLNPALWDEGNKMHPEVREALLKIAQDFQEFMEVRQQQKEEDIAYLESLIDKMNQVLEPMKSFILPGGHQAISTAHIARCVCRRAERWCVNLQEEDLFVEPLVIKYLNRLSDYLFVLSRYIGYLNGVPDSPWKPRL